MKRNLGRKRLYRKNQRTKVLGSSCSKERQSNIEKKDNPAVSEKIFHYGQTNPFLYRDDLKTDEINIYDETR